MATFNTTESLDPYRREDGGLCFEEDTTISCYVTCAGDLLVGGDLTVTAQARFEGDIVVAGDVSVTGGLHGRGWKIRGGVVIEGGSSATAPVQIGGDARLTSSFSAASNFKVEGGLEASGYFRSEGDLKVGADLSADDVSAALSIVVVGNAKASGAISTSADIDVGGDLDVEGGLSATQEVRVGGDMTVNGHLNTRSIFVGANLSITNDLYIAGSIDVGGEVFAAGNLTAESVRARGDINVTGDLNCQQVERFFGQAPPLESIEHIQIWNRAAIHTAPDEIVDRSPERRRVVRALLRSQTPTVFLLGDAGSGKTTMLKSLAKAALAGSIPGLRGWNFANLDTMALQRLTLQGKNLNTELVKTFSEVARCSKTILILDHLHYLKSENWMFNEVLHTLRSFVFRSEVRAVISITPALYQETVKDDPLYGKRVSWISLKPHSDEGLRSVMETVGQRLARQYQVAVTPEAIEASIHCLRDNAQGLSPPGGCVALLDDAASAALVDGRGTVTAQDVTAAAPPQEDDTEFDMTGLRSLEDKLKRWVLGQPEAVSSVVQRIQLTKLQLDRRPERPDGVFLLMGPSGVGKTELAKSVARALYDDVNRLVRLDMSEFMAEHEYSKFIGAPPGYLGHGTEGQLTGKIKRLGHGVVLLDEIDKAHASVLNLLLQVFDEGRLTDGLGETVDFGRFIIFMTSNMGRELWDDQSRNLGFMTAVKPSEPNAVQIREHLLRKLPAEFVNRVDALVPFQVLDHDNLRLIAMKLVADEVERWQRRGKHLSIEEDVVELVVEKGYDPRLGARHLERNLEELVVQPLSDVICSEGWDAVDTLHVTTSKERTIELTINREPTRAT